MLKKILLSLFIVSLFTLYGCGMKKFSQIDLPQKGEKIAVLNTASGVIKIRLFPDIAPKTVDNFIRLIEQKKYDNIIFHRIVSNFVIQSGDFENQDGTGGYSANGPGAEVQDEINPQLKHIKGAVAMAKKGGANSFGSQFYITLEATPFLDGDYTVFGQVFEGQDAIESIAKLPVDGIGRPTEIKNMKIVKAEQKALINQATVVEY